MELVFFFFIFHLTNLKVKPSDLPLLKNLQISKKRNSTNFQFLYPRITFISTKHAGCIAPALSLFQSHFFNTQPNFFKIPNRTKNACIRLTKTKTNSKSCFFIICYCPESHLSFFIRHLFCPRY